MRGPREQCESDVYHVVVRGVSRHLLFEDDGDRRTFLELMQNALKTQEMTVYAYCLMDNHVHMLVRAHMDVLSAGMHRVLSSYARYFNRRYDRVGHLFQGRFRSEPIDTDEYFLTALRYIHRNPKKPRMGPFDKYLWSSYREYVGESSGFTDTEFALSMFGSMEEFVSFHNRPDADEVECLEAFETRRQHDDRMAIRVALETVGLENLDKIGSLPHVERNARLSQLRNAGLSIRQIERLTGVSRGIIANATTHRT